jgi:hypothetical protein
MREKVRKRFFPDFEAVSFSYGLNGEGSQGTFGDSKVVFLPEEHKPASGIRLAGELMASLDLRGKW